MLQLIYSQHHQPAGPDRRLRRRSRSSRPSTPSPSRCFERDKLARAHQVGGARARGDPRPRARPPRHRGQAREPAPRAEGLHAAASSTASICARRSPTRRPSPSCAWPAFAARRRSSSSCSPASTLPLVLFARRAVLPASRSSSSSSRRSIKVLIAVAVAYVGFYAPNLYVSNVISKRQTSIRRAWPDALDLLLICVESGMSAEAAFRKVSEEIGAQSVAARRGADADHGRAVLSAGAPPGLREPRHPHRPRRPSSR